MHFEGTLLKSDSESVAMSDEFAARLAQTRASFFSRDPEIWPAFADPNFRELLDFRFASHAPERRIDQYPKGSLRLEQLHRLDQIPQKSSEPKDGLDPLLQFSAALSKDWEHPSSVENVITMACDPGVYGSMLGTLANPNLVYQEYCGMADELEKAVVRQVANLVGYDANRATGIFTQGGTFCNMYGYLFGIRKSLPNSVKNGLDGGQDYRFINSQGGHYSNTTNLSVLGANVAKKTLRIKLTDTNDIDITDLERQMEACFRLGCVVPTIMLTMGTTDTFGVDQVKPVYELRNRLCEKFEIETPPHIHVDAAVGWPIIFFLNYDFGLNPLGINETTLKGLKTHAERFAELKFADSFTVDFQKWGYVPYTSSLLMVKDRDSMKALEHDPENFSYFEKDTQGQTHLQSTIECSRGAAGLFGAYTAMKYMGAEGYQTMIANGLQNANYFRHQLQQVPGSVLVASRNHGPSVGFRLYDTRTVKDPLAEWQAECDYSNTPEWHQRIDRNTKFHRELFLRKGKQHLFTNWVQFIAHTRYDEREKFEAIPGEKAVFFNPRTDFSHIDGFINDLRERLG